MDLCRKLTRWGLLSVAALTVALVAIGPVSADEKEDAKQKKREARQAAKKALLEKQKEAEAKAAATEPAKPTPAPASAPAAKTVSRAKEVAALIDREIDKRLKSEKIPASPPADDAEFLRRVSLDITGVIPTAERAAVFLDSKDPDKRAKLIDELLAAPGYGRHMADMWQARLLPTNSDNRRLQSEPLVKWLEDNFNANKSWDKFVHELLTASGTQEENGATTYFVANATVDLITDSVTKQFMGIQLQCAQCHNHPFTGWKQEQYWEMAAFFMKVRSDKVNKAVKNGESPGVSEAPRVAANRKGLPESAKMVPARFLQGEQPKLNATEPYRPVLASWLTSPKNPYFARAMVNRTWAQFFARGLVNSVDDMHPANTPSHPELLAKLSEGFANEGFDLKDLIRGMCNSQAYQRTSKPSAGNESAEAFVYSRMGIKALTPEQLYDSLVQVVGQPKGPAARVQGQRGQPRGPRAAFVASFQHDEAADPTEYQAGIPQALRLMNSSQFDTTNLVAGLTKGGRTSAETIEQLYLATLSRRPTAAEKDRLTTYVQKNDASKAYADIAWALFNSSEFALNR